MVQLLLPANWRCRSCHTAFPGSISLIMPGGGAAVLYLGGHFGPVGFAARVVNAGAQAGNNGGNGTANTGGGRRPGGLRQCRHRR